MPSLPLRFIAVVVPSIRAAVLPAHVAPCSGALRRRRSRVRRAHGNECAAHPRASTTSYRAGSSKSPYAETRRHLGVETQRQWSDRAAGGTVSILLDLFTLVTLLATHVVCARRLLVRTAGWYAKPVSTFSDALARVRRQWWRTATTPCMSTRERDMSKLPRRLVRHSATQTATQREWLTSNQRAVSEVLQTATRDRSTR